MMLNIRRLSYCLALASILSMSACSRILYEETDTHYFSSCTPETCQESLNRLSQQCQGEVLDAYIKRSSAIVLCRVIKSVESKDKKTP